MSDQTMDLEIRLAHQETMLNELSDVVAAQQTQIDRLTAELRRLKEHRTNNADEIMPLSDEVPPPHY